MKDKYHQDTDRDLFYKTLKVNDVFQQTSIDKFIFDCMRPREHGKQCKRNDYGNQ